MNKTQLRSKLEEMVSWLDEIISGASEQTRELEELIKFRNELKKLVERIDDDWDIDWPLVTSLMKRFVECLYAFSSN